jgi:SpoVK/Ycf46/Vps4 family AAA+-type ATPase
LDQPTSADVQAIVRLNMDRLSCAKEDDLDAAVMAAVLMTKRPSCADAEALCQRALALAIREEISSMEAEEGEGARGSNMRRRLVAKRHFVAALSELTGMSGAQVDALWGQRSVPFAWTGQFSG